MKQILWVFLCLFTFNSFAQSDKSTVIVLHLNDLHGTIDHMPALKYKVDSIKAIYDDVFLLSAGDFFSGNPYVDNHSEKGFPIIDLMNDVGVDVSAIGNHEFDYGQATLNRRVSQAKFPLICANIACENAIFDQPKGDCILKTKSGLSIGIVSLLQVNKNGLPETHPKNVKQIHFQNPLEIVKLYKDKLKNTDVQIALTHLGYEKDLELAKANPWLEAVVGGHSHTTLSEPVIVNDVVVTQAGCNVEYLGVLILQFKGGKLISVDDKLLGLKNQMVDSLMQKKVDMYSSNPEFENEIAFLPYTMKGEEEIGKVMAKAYQEELNVDIAFQNRGGVRLLELKEGSISKLDLMRLDPFNNEMVTFKMYPREMIEFLRYAHNLERPEYILTAGVEVKYVYNKLEELVDIKLMDMKGKPLIDEGLYTVAINSYMAFSYDYSTKIKAERTGYASNELLFKYFSRQFPPIKH